MVKKFRRPAAGIEAQIPSDLRTPQALTRSLNFLISDVIGNASSLESVHAFVWDRTRGVRNDFSVQQFTDLPRLKIGLRCFERIVRFHFLSRHQVGGRFPHVAPNYDHHQDGEQGFKSLFSLLKSYEDARRAGPSYRPPNEPEFQAYKIMTLIPRNDIELVKTLITTFPNDVRSHPHIQHAYNIYVSASTALNSDKVSLPVAQNNIMAFWNIIQQPQTTYMLACTAEIFFQEIRKLALHTALRTFGKNKGRAQSSDWNINDLKTPLGLDTDEEAREYIEAHNVVIKGGENGVMSLERKGSEALTLARLQSFKVPSIQYFCGRLVESKRAGRGVPDIINQPDVAGVPIEDENEEETLFVPQNPVQQPSNPFGAAAPNNNMLKPPSGRVIAKAKGARGAKRLNPSGQGFNPSEDSGNESATSDASSTAHNPFGGNRPSQGPAPNRNPFAQTSTQQNPFSSKPQNEAAQGATQNPFGSTFGQPSTGFGTSTFGQLSNQQTQPANPFGKPSPSPFGGPTGQQTPNANPFGAPAGQQAQPANPFGGASASSPFGQTQNQQPFGQPSGQPSFGQLNNPSPTAQNQNTGFAKPPSAFQFPNTGENTATSGVFMQASQPTSNQNTPASSFSFTGPGFGQPQPPASQTSSSFSFEFGAKQDGAAAPATTGVQSAPSSFNFDFGSGGGASAPKQSAGGFNNPFAAGGQSRGMSFDSAKSQASSQPPNLSSGTSMFQFGGMQPATTPAEPFSGIPQSSEQPKTASAFSFTSTSNATTNGATSSTTAAAPASKSTSEANSSPFNFSFGTTAAGSSAQTPTSKSPTAPPKLPSFEFGADSTKDTPASEASKTLSQSAKLEFGPSAVQQKAELQKGTGKASITGPNPSEQDSDAASIDQPAMPSFGWPSTEEPGPLATSDTLSTPIPLPPATIKKTPKKERPAVNEFGFTKKQQKRKDDCMDYIVRELFLLPEKGILDQYIDWKMWPVFQQAKLEREQVLEHKEFAQKRNTWLLRKYGDLWKSKASTLRHRRLGRERRARLEKIRMDKAAKHEEEKRKALFQLNAERIMAQAEDSLRRSQSSRQKLVIDNDLSASISPPSLAVQTPPRSFLRRPVLRQPPASEPSRKINDKRFETSAAKTLTPSRSGIQKGEQAGDQSYTPPRLLSGDPLRQSEHDPLPAKLSTVRSDYFRLKAMGLKHLSPAFYKNTSRWKEKEDKPSASVLPMPSSQFSQSASSTAFEFGDSLLDQHNSLGSAKKSVRFDESVTVAPIDDNSLLGNSILYNGLTGSGKRPQPEEPLDSVVSPAKRIRLSDNANLLNSINRIPNDSSAGKRKYEHIPPAPTEDILATMDEDERRIARIKALTSRMAHQTDIFRDPLKDPLPPLQPLSESLGASHGYSDNERASKRPKLSMSQSTRDDELANARKTLPAYWFRESKFVPRSEYGLGPKSKRLAASSSGIAATPPQSGATSLFSPISARVNGSASVPSAGSTHKDEIILIDSSDEDESESSGVDEVAGSATRVKSGPLFDTLDHTVNHDEHEEYESEDLEDGQAEEEEEESGEEGLDGYEDEAEDQDGLYEEDEEEDYEEDDESGTDEDRPGASAHDPIVL
jgi:SAC3/GANP family